MLAKTRSVALVGTEARLVEVEVRVSTGVPGFRVVGLPAASVREAEQRTRSAIESSQERWPASKIIANLAPGELRKEGTHFDLAIGLGILGAHTRLSASKLDGWVMVGELALDGTIRSVRGTLAAAIACREMGLTGIICPAPNAAEASMIEGIEVVPVKNLVEAIGFFRGTWSAPVVEQATDDAVLPVADMREVRGHSETKRALEIAAAGGHNTLLIGPPGSGKTMLASRLPGILPPLGMEEALEVTRIHSIAGVLPRNCGLVRARPFRNPHHHVSVAGLVGGGSTLPRPGEASLAHHGVLFLDELPLYRADVLESLRAPIEEGSIRLARTGGVVTFPCRFMFVAAMNPCSCGHSGDNEVACRCSDREISRYRNRLSGPLVDRIDVTVVAERVAKAELLSEPQGPSSDEIRGRVCAARKRQEERYASSLLTNATVPKALLEQAVQLDASSRGLIGLAVDEAGLSGRGIDKVFRVARTVADLAEEDRVTDEHVADALNLRPNEQKLAGAA